MFRYGRATAFAGLMAALVLALTISTGVVAQAAPIGAPADPVSAPVTLVQGGIGYTPTVRISVAGSEPMTVLLDSGSSGLVLNTPDVPSHVRDQLTNLHASVDQDYTSGNVTGDLYTGEISLLGAQDVPVGQWTAPLVIGECAQSGCGWPRPGIKGVLGIASGVHEVTTGSGTVAFASPFTTAVGTTGVAFHFDATSLTGVFAVGSTAGVTGTTLQAPSEGTTYANGLDSFHHYVAGCWIIETITSCDAFTTFDSGAEYGFISSSQFDPLFGHDPKPIPLGTIIRFSSADGAPEFGSLTVSRPDFDLKYDPGARSNPLSNNSGSGFLLDRDIAIDYASGTVIIGGLGSSVLTPNVAPPQLAATGPDAFGVLLALGGILAGGGLVAMRGIRRRRELGADSVWQPSTQ